MAAPEELPWDEDSMVVVDHDDFGSFDASSFDTTLPLETEQYIRNWLQPTEYNASNGECSKHRASHVPGTGDWLWESEAYSEWHGGSDHGMLLIKGIPGSGKSVIAGSLIDRLSQEGVPVLYFFFRQIIDANHTPDALLRDWLDQILSYSEPLQLRLKEYVEKRRDLSSVSMSDLWRHLKLSLADLPKAYCVVDALDEMDIGNDEFLRALCELGRWRPANIKVVATSRPITRIEFPIRQIPMLDIRLQEEVIEEDIATYVQHRLQESGIPESQHEVIKRAVPGKANGLFLYAKLAMDAFLKDGVDIQQVTDNLPADLNVLYTDLLQQHIQQSEVLWYLQILILSWVTHASRPLRLLEIAEMINKTHNTDLSSDLKAKKELVRNSCGPLLEILPDETVCVIHHSLTEFLKGSTRRQSLGPIQNQTYPVLDMGATHARLAQVCISYLLGSGCLDVVGEIEPIDNRYIAKEVPEPEGDTRIRTELKSQHPFLGYCLQYWHFHARKADDSIPLTEELLCALDELLSSKKNTTALAMLAERKRDGWEPIHMASFYGLSQYVSRILERGNVNVETLDEADETPMLYAAGNGHSSVIKVLLSNGADPDGPSRKNGVKPLHLAALRNHGKVVDLLLRAGVHPFTRKTMQDPHDDCIGTGTKGHTPLMYATLYGHREAARAFLPYLNQKIIINRALVWAAQGGHSGIVEDVLKHPLVDVNAKIRCETAIFHAAKRTDIGHGDINTIIALLKAGADPSIQCIPTIDEFEGWVTEDEDRDEEEEPEENKRFSRISTAHNALHALCGAYGERYYAWKESPVFSAQTLNEVMSLMSRKSLDVNARDRTGATALRYAVQNMPMMVEPLLKAGANAKIQQKNGETILHGCSDPHVLQLLVEEGQVDINQVETENRRSPLLFAAVKSWLTPEIIQKYAELGANMSHTDMKGQGALHLYLGDSFKENESAEIIVSTLLEMGVPPNLKNHKGETALHMVIQRCNKKESTICQSLLSVLVSRGVDPNVRDNAGETPLFKLVSNAWDIGGLLDLVRTLFELGAQPNAVDYRGRNVLFHLPKRTFPGLVEELLERGVNPNVRDHEGNPYDWALSDPGYVNNLGQSHIHIVTATPDSVLDDLSTYPDIDAKDNEGSRPLHIAARSNEKHVAALLAAGASPTEPTYEGVTPLHVAARFRQPNIVGRLIQAIRAQSGNRGLLSHLNYVREQLPSALHLACRSGVPETVSLLLEAGADPNLYFDQCHDLLQVPYPLIYLAKHEEEEKLWTSRAIRNQHRNSSSREMDFKALGIKLNDQWRPDFDEEPPMETCTCLEGVLDLLCYYGAQMVDSQGQSVLEIAIQEGQGNDYTTECLIQLQSCVNQGQSGVTSIMSLMMSEFPESCVENMESVDYGVLAALYRRASTREAFFEAPPDMATPFQPRFKSEPQPDITVYDLAKDHQWGLILQTATEEEESFLSGYYGEASISHLVLLGLESIVRELLTPESLKELEQRHQQDMMQPPPRFRGALYMTKTLEPLLLTACRRKQWNLPMIRLLVEHLGADVNIRGLEVDNNRIVRHESALHVLARQDSWAASEAIQYLVDHGADVNIRDHYDRTPLMCTTSENTARMFLGYGADIHARTRLGKNCIDFNTECLARTKFLLSCGAQASIQSAFYAMESQAVHWNGDAAILDVLGAKVDLNARLTQKDAKLKFERRYTEKYAVNREELYLLYLAALYHPMSLTVYNRTDLSKAEIYDRHLPVLSALLKRGASPYAKFMRQPPQGSCEPPQEFTVLHDILEHAGLVEPILQLPDLDVNYKDAQGRTLLLAACRSIIGPDSAIDDFDTAFQGRYNGPEFEKKTEKPSFAQFLVDKGAIVTVQDKDNKNALHHLLQSESRNGSQSLGLLLSLAPELVHQVDNDGATPMLYALQRVASKRAIPSDVEAVAKLLEAGADPNVTDRDGNTALHFLGARLAGFGWDSDEVAALHDLFRGLVELGLSINAKNNRGETPIFAYFRDLGEASSHKHDINYDIVKQNESLDLWISGSDVADVFHVDDEGNTLLHYVAATSSGLQKNDAGTIMVDRFLWLVEQGLDAGLENQRSQTCLDVAKVNDNDAILALFQQGE
ncbi:unnamed protein product [Clonostachys rosea f. rosea IK726]|uniref:Uncharacterized protein n=1 Tax=Clonostachys rosea f. rosea IK726 TaxID=1349383 RepID=A0ACA9UTV5_BIOOC|nr:unnamed protein product [Clonostachys rosea f. rosea IK726]